MAGVRGCAPVATSSLELVLLKLANVLWCCCCFVTCGDDVAHRTIGELESGGLCSLDWVMVFQDRNFQEFS